MRYGFMARISVRARHRPERAGLPCRRTPRQASTPRHGYVPARATRNSRRCDRSGPVRYSRTGRSNPLRRLEVELPQQRGPRGREIFVDLGKPHQVIVERADLRGAALWQGSLDPAPDPIRKRADDFLLDDKKIANLPVVGVGPDMRSVLQRSATGRSLSAGLRSSARCLRAGSRRRAHRQSACASVGLPRYLKLEFRAMTA